MRERKNPSHGWVNRFEAVKPVVVALKIVPRARSASRARRSLPGGWSSKSRSVNGGDGARGPRPALR
jgi:hypothetical protein